MPPQTNSSQPVRRLTRLEQLTLNTWRWASATVQNTMDPSAILELRHCTPLWAHCATSMTRASVRRSPVISLFQRARGPLRP
jgi:hypothetical protein